MATIKDVAQLAGVSFATVSYVLNDSMPVSEATRNKVLAAVTKLGYQPHRQGRNLQRQRTLTIGVLLPQANLLCEVDLATWLLEATNAATSAGYSLLLQPADSQARGDLADGWISFGTPLDPQLPQVWALAPPCDQPAVLCDAAFAAQRAVETLTHSGMRRIGLITLPRSIPGSARWYLGYRRALRRAGLGFDPGLVVEPAANRFHDGVAAYETLAASENDYDGLIVCGHQLATGVVMVDHAKVPVIVSHSSSQRGISGFRWPTELWAHTLVRKLLQQLDGAAIAHRTWLNPSLVIGSLGFKEDLDGFNYV
ncbi:LacI family DNA-binding transcriptional regulator [Herpetosiphon giganteus]|uniref:LacI family DNA-binding transcriptional regulator n=1 Tax=Herpetosiphon giganteus TaxID=2029754 RepID=UPI00195E9A0B|nr:LacI family DNA-binding transcriptional regulator [Herpetosiphon giganteus]MBM7843602.1 DNA-binding LacI/PurR family transcriptional regulator [Herpetosiphon giganteus]